MSQWQSGSDIQWPILETSMAYHHKPTARLMGQSGGQTIWDLGVPAPGWLVWMVVNLANLLTTTEIYTSNPLVPIHVQTGQNPQLGMEPLRESCLKTLNNFTSRMTVVTNEVSLALTKAMDDMAWFLMSSEGATLYKTGDKVWLNGQKYHHKSSNEEAWSQMAQSILGLKSSSHGMPIGSNYPCLLGCIHTNFSVTLLRPTIQTPITKHIQSGSFPTGNLWWSWGQSWTYSGEPTCSKETWTTLVHWKGYGIEEDEWRLVEDIKGWSSLYLNSIVRTQMSSSIYQP